MTKEVDKPRPEPWKDGRLPEVLCSAHKTNGEPCKKPPIKGSNVCRVHGGAAIQTKRKAQVRLLMAADRLTAQLVEIAEDKKQPPAVRLAAIRDALDRAGLTAKTELDIDVKVSVWDQNAADIITVVSETVKVDTEQAQIVDAEVVETEEAEDWQADIRPSRRGLPYLPSERKKAAPVSLTPPETRVPRSVPAYDGPAATDLPKPPARTAKQRKADEVADAANRAVEARAAREARPARRRKPRPR